MRHPHLQSIARFIGTLSIAIALFSLSGGHWALLQGVAWGRMIQQYSAQGSFNSAIKKTFDGHHRCSLCKKIDQAKQKEKKQCFTSEIFKKKEGLLGQSFSLLILVANPFHFSPMKKSFYAGPRINPLLPPPRAI